MANLERQARHPSADPQGLAQALTEAVQALLAFAESVINEEQQYPGGHSADPHLHSSTLNLAGTAWSARSTAGLRAGVLPKRNPLTRRKLTLPSAASSSTGSTTTGGNSASGHSSTTCRTISSPPRSSPGSGALGWKTRLHSAADQLREDPRPRSAGTTLLDLQPRRCARRPASLNSASLQPVPPASGRSGNLELRLALEEGGKGD